MATNLTHTCPKCSGSGLVIFKHIENGVCFLCGGGKLVSETTASRWLASQLDRAPRGEVAPAKPASPAQPCKMVDLGAFGTVKIVRTDDGDFNASRIRIPDEDYGFQEYNVFFKVCGGRVAIDGDTVQHGMRRHWRAVQAALQAALKI